MATVSTRCCFSQSARACKSAVQRRRERTSTQSVPGRGDSDDMEVAADVSASGVGVKDVEGAAGERIGGEGWFDAGMGALPEEEAKQAAQIQ